MLPNKSDRGNSLITLLFKVYLMVMFYLKFSLDLCFTNFLNLMFGECEVGGLKPLHPFWNL